MCFWSIFWEIFGVPGPQQRIDVDPSKATTIATMKPLATMKELKSFEGKVSYIRRFILDLASITSTFTKLLKKGQSFEWGKAQQTAFRRLQ